MQNQRLIEIFLDLVKIEGESGKEKEIALYIFNFLKALKLNPYFDNSQTITGSNTGNLICKIGDGGEFILLSHMDTARSTKGLVPTIKNGKITSDGNTILGADNRAGIASILYVCERIVKESLPHKNFTIAFTVQEETTLNGSTNIELESRIRKGFVFDSHLKPGNFVCESVGAIGFDIKVMGKASHSGLAPEKGIDAIKIAADAISKIKLGRIDEITTANIGKISGGNAINVVPDSVLIEGEIRSTTEEKIFIKLNEIKKEFNESCFEKGGQIVFNYRWDFKPYKINFSEDVFKDIETAISLSDLNPVSQKSWGGSDANSLNAKGIRCVNIGIGAENPHSNDEYILIEDLEKSTQIALNLIKL